jgi:hypothetical protein
MDESGPWGDDQKLFGSYAIRGASAVVRVLLPAIVEETGQDITWAVVAADFGRSGYLDGYTSWAELTELPGDGSWAPSRRYRPASGLVPESVITRLTKALQPDDDKDFWITMPPDPVGSRARQDLQPTTLATPGPIRGHGRRRPSQPDLTSGSAPATQPVGALAAIARRWAVDGFPGRAWKQDQSVGIAAPRYADSLIVSGPSHIATHLAASGLEAYQVDAGHLLPRLVS